MKNRILKYPHTGTIESLHINYNSSNNAFSHNYTNSLQDIRNTIPKIQLRKTTPSPTLQNDNNRSIYKDSNGPPDVIFHNLGGRGNKMASNTSNAT